MKSENQKEIVKIEKVHDAKTHSAVKKANQEFNHIFMGAALFATGAIGSIMAAKGLGWYHQVGLAVPALTSLYGARMVKNMDLSNNKEVCEEEMEITNISTSKSEKVNKIVEFGKKSWKYTKLLGGVTSIATTSHAIATIGLQNLSSIQTLGLCSAMLANAALISRNLPTMNIDEHNKTMTKGLKK